MPFRHKARRIFLAPAVGLTLAATLAACSSGSSSSSTASTPASISSSATAASGGSAAAIAQIKANWVKFFSSSTPNSERVALLQNGQSFASSIKSFAANPLAADVTSKVDSVTLTSATLASVKYDLTAAGTSVASGQTGSAVLQNGVWKVGDDIFCGLLKEAAAFLKIALPAACK
jgi:hypothetical protein